MLTRAEERAAGVTAAPQRYGGDSGGDPRFDRMRPVSCAACGAAVLVAKFSPQHTSVQWSLPAMRTCLEFGAATIAGEPTAPRPEAQANSALNEGCGRLRASIDAAVRGGRLPVAPP